MVHRRTLLGCALALAFPLTACDSDPDPMDGGTGETDSGSMMGTPPPPVGTGEEGMPLAAADYSCRGSVTAPAGGADVTFTATAEDFQSGMIVEGLTVHFFPDNTVVDGCTGSCQMLTTDASGQASVTAPEGGWYAYRIVGGEATHNSVAETFVTAIQVNEAAAEAGGEVTLNAVRQTTVNLLTSVAIIQPQPGTATLSGQIADCAGDAVANARIRVFDSTGAMVELGSRSTGPKVAYFNGAGTLPDTTATESSVSGLYALGNIPTGAVRVETWGVVSEGGDMEMLGCERVEAVADGITIINVGPTRSDGPSDCSGG